MAEDVQLENPNKKRKLDEEYDNLGNSDSATVEDTTYSSLQLSDTDMNSHRNAGEGGQTDDDLLETSKSCGEKDCDSDSSSGYSNVSGEEAWRPISGPMSWVYRHIEKGSDPRQILQQIVPDDELPRGLPPDIPDYMLWKLVISIVSEPPMRKKLDHVNTLADVVHLMKTCSKIVVLTGAGVSVSCGIPDFRSRNGIYARLAVDFPDLPDPQAMFDINYFRNDQRPFFKFAKEIYPGQFEPSKCHKFIRLIEDHDKLLRNYTQNIDTLEQVAGITNIIQCHGSFATATCMLCRHKCTAEDIKGPIMEQIIPRCPECPDVWPNAVMKPDIVFFGESLPEEFHNQMAADKDECDLLIVIGSSLKVRPVALIPNSLPADIPQILINKEPLKGQRFDVELLGDCDIIVGELCRQLGDSWDVLSDGATALTEVSTGMLLTPPATPDHGHGDGMVIADWEAQSFGDCGQQGRGGGVDTNIAADTETDTVVTDLQEGHTACDHGEQTSRDKMQTGERENGGTTPSLPASSDLVTAQSGRHSGLDEDLLSLDHICLPDPGSNDTNKAASDNPKSGQNEGACGNISVTGSDNLSPHELAGGTRVSETVKSVSSAAESTVLKDGESETSESNPTSNVTVLQKDNGKDVVNHVNPTAEPQTDQTAGSAGSDKAETKDSGVAYGDKDTCGTSSDVEELRMMWKPAVARISVSKRLEENQYCFMPPSRYVFTDAEVYTELDTDSEVDADMDDENNSATSPDDHSDYSSDVADENEVSSAAEMDSGLTDAGTSVNSTKDSVDLVEDTEGSSMVVTDVDDCNTSTSCTGNSESVEK